MVCSNFNSDISSSGSAIKFAFKITNPVVASGKTMLIPLEIYSEQSSTRRKTNY